MTTRVLIKNGRVLDPASGRDAVMDLLIENWRIAAIAAGIAAEDARIIDASGLWVAPGFIDLHVHLREPGQEDRETIQSGAEAAVRGGYTAVCSMPNTDPPVDSAGAVRYIIERAKSAGLARVYPVAAITRGLEGTSLTNMSTLHDEGAVAFSDDGRTVMDALIMRRAMEYARGIPAPLALHSIDENLAKGGQINEGVVSARLGLHGIPSHAETIAVGRDIALAELTGCRIHICHVSAKESVELIRNAKARGIAVTAEVTPHHLALTEQELRNYDTRFKMNPPLRTEEDRCALIAGLVDGSIDCVATDHAPHTEIDKDLPFDAAPFGTIGLETALSVTYSVLVKTGLISPSRWIEAMSASPARIFALPGGSLATGAAADITIIDPNAEVHFLPEKFKSRSRNSAFAGHTYSAAAAYTIVRDKIFDFTGEIR